MPVPWTQRAGAAGLHTRRPGRTESRSRTDSRRTAEGRRTTNRQPDLQLRPQRTIWYPTSGTLPTYCSPRASPRRSSATPTLPRAWRGATGCRPCRPRCSPRCRRSVARVRHRSTYDWLTSAVPFIGHSHTSRAWRGATGCPPSHPPCGRPPRRSGSRLRNRRHIRHHRGRRPVHQPHPHVARRRVPPHDVGLPVAVQVADSLHHVRRVHRVDVLALNGVAPFISQTHSSPFARCRHRMSDFRLRCSPRFHDVYTGSTVPRTFPPRSSAVHRPQIHHARRRVPPEDVGLSVTV